MIRYDVRGHGGSAAPPGPYTVEQMADDLRERLGAIRVPALVGGGEQDPGTPVAMAREIHARIAGTRLLILPGAMHASPVEAAADFNRALLDFLPR